MFLVGNKRHMSAAQMALPTTVYIGRPSAWGNPFVVSQTCPRGEAIKKYIPWFLEKLRSCKGCQKEFERLLELERKLGTITLVCWCHPNACHGDTLANLLNAKLKKR